MDVHRTFVSPIFLYGCETWTWMESSANRGCHEEGSGGGTTFWDVLKLPGHTKLILWPEIRSAAAERALDGQAWRAALLC
eukprot:364218-Chlamydomonas_euryale.AAC.9